MRAAAGRAARVMERRPSAFSPAAPRTMAGRLRNGRYAAARIVRAYRSLGRISARAASSRRPRSAREKARACSRCDTRRATRPLIRWRAIAIAAPERQVAAGAQWPRALAQRARLTRRAGIPPRRRVRGCGGAARCAAFRDAGCAWSEGLHESRRG